MNGKCDVAPTIPTIKKIASVAKDVTYTELLEVADYNPEIYDDVLEPLANEGITNRLLVSLANVTFSWKFENPIAGSNGPIAISLNNALFKKWYFIPIVKERVTREDITTALGSKDAEKIVSCEKVSFIATKIEIIDELKKMEFNFMSLRMWVIYASKDKVLVASEYYIKTAIAITDEDE